MSRYKKSNKIKNKVIKKSYLKPPGLKWNSVTYKKLIVFISSNNWNEDFINLSEMELNNLSINIYSNHAKRRQYRNNVSSFLNQYAEDISEDITAYKNNNKIEIIAPELKYWLNLKRHLIEMLSDSSIKYQVNEFIDNTSYKFDLDIRKEMVKGLKIFHYKQEEDWLLKKLDNVFMNNRMEIIDGLQERIRSLTNELKNDTFSGFSKEEIIEGMVFSKVFTTVKLMDSSEFCGLSEKEVKKANALPKNAIDSQQVIDGDSFCSFSNEVNKRALLDKANITNASSSRNNSPRRKHSKDSLLEKICSDINALYEDNENHNQQIELFKKLVIYHFISRHDCDMNTFMTANRVSTRIKSTILKHIYDKVNEESLIKNGYTLLDLLIPYRYVLRRKVKALDNLFTINRMTTDLFKQYSDFKDVEYRFYEALQEIKQSKTEKRRNTT